LEALTEAVEQVAGLAKAGLTGPELWAPIFGQDGIGQDGIGHDGEALTGWARQFQSTPLEPFANAILAVHRVAVGAGASTAALLGAITKALADAQETADAVANAMAGPKSSARLLQFLPLLGIVLGTAMGASPLPVLFGGGAGTVALAVGAVSLIIGKLWTSLMIRAAARPPSTDPLVASVLAAALRAGLVLPAALVEVGAAWPGRLGSFLEQVGRGLARGLSWDAAWSAAGVGDGAAATAGFSAEGFAQALRRALRPVWESGAEAGPLLEGVAARATRAERRRLGQAAARLGVHLMAPLGLCYLPAFIALGLAPVVLSLAGSILTAT
jgi:tight adherence protein B